MGAFDEMLERMVDAAMERPWDEILAGRAEADRVYWERIDAALAP